MRASHELPQINPDDPFSPDDFNRKEHAIVLTQLINLHNEGFVIGLNGSWGIGKTTFLERWMHLLKNQEHHVAYFNAWSDDYSSDPLPALLATFKDLVKPDGKEAVWGEVLKAGSAFAKNALPTVLGFWLQKQTGISNINDVVKALGEGGVDYLTAEVSEFGRRKELLQQLKTKLSEYLGQNPSGKKSVVIIDELDRCRPNYAVSVLELVKHLFAIKDVVFVLAIDKEQLKHAICGVYGSPSLDANAYLQRFINIEYRLPAPDADKLARYFTEYCIYDLLKQATSGPRAQARRLDLSLFAEFVALFQADKQLSIRNLERIFITTTLALDSLKYHPRKVFELVFFLSYLMHHHPQEFELTKSNSMSTFQFFRTLQGFLPNADIEFDWQLGVLTSLEASILVLFNNQTNKVNKINLSSDYVFNQLPGTDTWIMSKYETESRQLRLNLSAVLGFESVIRNMHLTQLVDAVQRFKGLDG